MDYIKLKAESIARRVSDSMPFNALGRSIHETLIRRYADRFLEPSSSSNTCVLTLNKKEPLTGNFLPEKTSSDIGKTVDDTIEINKERLARLADLMSVFADEDNWTSDQDELIEELQEIGFLKSLKHKRASRAPECGTNSVQCMRRNVIDKRSTLQQSKKYTSSKFWDDSYTAKFLELIINPFIPWVSDGLFHLKNVHCYK